MKRILLSVLSLLLLLSLFSCAGNNTPAADTSSADTGKETTAETADSKETETTEKTEVSVYALNGPTGMGCAKLNTDAESGSTKNNYKFTYVAAPDAVVAAISSKDADIAAIPVNLAATLNKKTSGGVKVICVNTLGVLYMLEDGNTVQSIADLKGKTILATGQASTPEYILRYLLTKNGIDPDKDVTIEYSSELNACGEGQIVMLPEPKVTVALNGNPNARVALNLTEEWNKVSEEGSELVQGVVIVRTEFAEQNPQAVADFLAEYAASVEYTNANPTEASELIAKYGIVAKAPLAAKAIPNCNMTCVTGKEMKTMLVSMYGMLLQAEPKSIGGELPADSFYYGAD